MNSCQFLEHFDKKEQQSLFITIPWTEKAKGAFLKLTFTEKDWADFTQEYILFIPGHILEERNKGTEKFQYELHNNESMEYFIY